MERAVDIEDGGGLLVVLKGGHLETEVFVKWYLPSFDLVCLEGKALNILSFLFPALMMFSISVIHILDSS